MPHRAIPCEEPKEDAAEMLDVEDMDVDDEPHLDFRSPMSTCVAPPHTHENGPLRNCQRLQLRGCPPPWHGTGVITAAADSMWWV